MAIEICIFTRNEKLQTPIERRVGIDPFFGSIYRK